MLHARSACRRAPARSSSASRPISRCGKSPRPPSSPTRSARTPAAESCVAQHFFEQRPKARPNLPRHILAETERRLLFHVDRFGKLELNGVYLLQRVAVSARDIAAL